MKLMGNNNSKFGLKFVGLFMASMLVMFAMTMMACDNDENITEPVDHPPQKPTAPAPYDGALEQNLYITLEWESVDQDGDFITYDLYFGTENPPALLESNLADYIYPLYRHFGDRLDFHTTYYWKVVAHSTNETVEGDVWSFTTSNVFLLSAGDDHTFDTRNANKLYVKDITADSCWIFVADDNNGLALYTLTDTTVIRNRVDTLIYKTGAMIGLYSEPMYVYDVDVVGDLAFMSYEEGLKILDFTMIDTSGWEPIGSYDSDDDVYAVDVVGNYAYLGTTNGMDIVDISDPSTPTLAGSYETSYKAMGVYCDGSNAYIADSDAGLLIVDITDPANPADVGAFSIDEGQAWAVTLVGDLAYIAYGESGLVIADVADPASPMMIGSYNTPGESKDVFVMGDYAYVADSWNGGLQIIDIITPSSPMLAGYRNHYGDGGASGVFANDNYVFLADRWNGVLVMEFQP